MILITSGQRINTPKLVARYFAILGTQKHFQKLCTEWSLHRPSPSRRAARTQLANPGHVFYHAKDTEHPWIFKAVGDLPHALLPFVQTIADLDYHNDGLDRPGLDFTAVIRCRAAKTSSSVALSSCITPAIHSLMISDCSSPST